MVNAVAAVAAGGALGALLRYWTAAWVYARAGAGFPYGTLVVNVAGSLLMGFAFVLLNERLALGPEWRALLMVGVLGAFTTFSTFSMDTLNLLLDAEYAKAVMNVLLSVVLCVAAAGLGLLLGRQV